MSRIGKKPIAIPEKVTVEIAAGEVLVKGPLGELNWDYPDKMKVVADGGTISVERSGDSKMERALHGLTRSILHNMVVGVSQGYRKVLEIFGVGYKAQVSGDRIVFALGYSHQIEFLLPPNVKASVDQKQVQITLTSIDKQQIGQVAASLKSLRLPDAYKGKGIRYAGERLKLKAGKAGKK
ncbi:MAG: 50S ribosomal protein L6 [Thermodesulfovibrionales bacterium]|nr:50S ribosomal protein L6 [Thermodesulfovibrionales bacterium]